MVPREPPSSNSSTVVPKSLVPLTVNVLGCVLPAPGAVIAGTAGVMLVSRDGGRSFELSQQEDRKAIAALVPSGDGALIVAGEGGVRRLPLPGGRAP